MDDVVGGMMIVGDRDGFGAHGVGADPAAGVVATRHFQWRLVSAAAIVVAPVIIGRPQRANVRRRIIARSDRGRFEASRFITPSPRCAADAVAAPARYRAARLGERHGVEVHVGMGQSEFGQRHVHLVIDRLGGEVHIIVIVFVVIGGEECLAFELGRPLSGLGTARRRSEMRWLLLLTSPAGAWTRLSYSSLSANLLSLSPPPPRRRPPPRPPRRRC